MGTLYLHSVPLAFMSLIPAYVIGEAWLGICLTVAIELVQPEVSPASISLFLFISNNISSVMPLLLPLLKDFYGLQRAMLILFPGLYVISATLFSLSLGLLIVRDLCQKSDGVKLKSPGHAQQASRQRSKRRKAHSRLKETSPLLREKNPNLQGDSDSCSSDTSDCGMFEEIDEREQKEAQKAVRISQDNHPRPIIVAASLNDREEVGERGWAAGGASNVDFRGGASVSVMSESPGRERAQRRGKVERGRRGRGRGYGAVNIPSGSPRGVRCVSEKQPAPVVGSVSEWSMLSPSKEEKQWLAESHGGI